MMIGRGEGALRYLRNFFSSFNLIFNSLALSSLKAQQVSQHRAKAMKTIDLSRASSRVGQVLGSPPYKGECAAGVQQLFAEAGLPLGLTSSWVQGPKVRGSRIPPGTAIASFRGGKYWTHAAVFVRETAEGIEVYDQWVGQPWHKRVLRFDRAHDGRNSGDDFYAIQ